MHQPPPSEKKQAEGSNDPLQDIPEFTPEQLAKLKARSRQYEADFVPTQSLFPDLR